MALDRHLEPAWWTLRIGLGLMAFLAGLDKFFNILANWTMYLNPLALRVLPLSADTLMRTFGVVEMAVGIAILTSRTRLGAYVAMAWLICIALSLVTMGAFFDIAVRDVELSLAAFTLARLTESRAAVPVSERVAPASGLGRLTA